MKKTYLGLTAAAVLSALGILTWLWGAQFFHYLWSILRVGMVPALILIGVGTSATVFFWRRVQYSEDRAIAVGVSWVVALVLAVGVAIPLSGYMAPARYNEVVETQSAEELDFRQRVPHDVATAMSDRNLGATTGDAVGQVRAIPAAGDHGSYTTAVVRRGWLKGYESVQTLTPPNYGTPGAQDVEFCEFSPDAKLRLGGGAPSNNLGRAIMWRTSPSTLVDPKDALFNCEDGVPMVYVPLTKLDGSILLPIRVPAGVAVYNGQTGELDIHEEFESDLPLYPQSVTENQREALTRSGSFADWLFGRSGYEDTSVDAEDPNGDNRAEFALADGSGMNQYHVTPLTPRGASSSIIALGTLQSDGTIRSGELRPYMVSTYEEAARQANSATADRITGEVLSGYMASGLRVFEVVPSENGTWTATVGKEQAVLYRAIISSDGKVDLRDANGRPVGTSSTSEDGGSDAGSVIDAGKPVDQMTNEELTDLADQILSELAQRADSTE